MIFPNKKSFKLSSFFEDYMKEIQRGFESIDLVELETIVAILNDAIINQRTIFTCGNGGSAAIADHFVCDFLMGTSAGASVQPMIHSLVSNTPAVTAVANDIGYEDIFSFQLNRFGREDDVLLSVSSSGNSPNIIKAIETAKSKEIKVISLVGFTGGAAKKISDNCIHIPCNNYGIVEDMHHSLMHMLAMYIRLTNLDDKKNVENIVF